MRGAGQAAAPMARVAAGLGPCAGEPLGSAPPRRRGAPEETGGLGHAGMRPGEERGKGCAEGLLQPPDAWPEGTLLNPS